MCEAEHGGSLCFHFNLNSFRRETGDDGRATACLRIREQERLAIQQYSLTSAEVRVFKAIVCGLVTGNNLNLAQQMSPGALVVEAMQGDGTVAVVSFHHRMCRNR